MFFNSDGSITLRKDTKANWESVNPVLEDGELVVEIDGNTFKLKVGNGTSKYISLPYISSGGDDSKFEEIEQEIAALQNAYPVYSFTKNISFPVNTWIDVGISGSDLASGVYILYFYPTETVSQQLWSERYVGLIYWFSTGTNSSNATDIPIHYSGHANNSTHIQARTQRSRNTESNPFLRLQLCSDYELEAKNWVFQFKKMM